MRRVTLGAAPRKPVGRPAAVGQPLLAKGSARALRLPVSFTGQRCFARGLRSRWDLCP